jgi:hypothetical protein
MFSQYVSRLSIDQLDTLLILTLLGGIAIGKLALIVVKRYL